MDYINQNVATTITIEDLVTELENHSESTIEELTEQVKITKEKGTHTDVYEIIAR